MAPERKVDLEYPAEAPHSVLPADRRFAFLEEVLARVQGAGLYRQLVPLHGNTYASPAKASISLCSNDYLGLARDVRVVAGAQQAIRDWGGGSGSSRLIAGELGIYHQLEEALADHLGYESALIFNSGYHANLGLFGTVPGRDGITLSDVLNHASIIDGIRLGRSHVRIFPHNSLDDVTARLGDLEGRPTLLVTEGLFSMDGDRAPVPALRSRCLEAGALLVVDDAHALGALGPLGRGTAWAGAPGGGADILVGTFGKALGAAGAFVAGPKIVRETLINLARTFIFTTGPAPAAVGAALAALKVIQTDPEPQSRLHHNVRLFRAGLHGCGLGVSLEGDHIVPLLVGDAGLALQFSRLLAEEGIQVRAIRPPTVPPGTSRLRFTLSAAHEPSDLERSVETIARIGHRLGVGRGEGLPEEEAVGPVTEDR